MSCRHLSTLTTKGRRNEVAPGVFVDSTSRIKKINGTGRMPMVPSRWSS